jgi:hypothetical protein
MESINDERLSASQVLLCCMESNLVNDQNVQSWSTGRCGRSYVALALPGMQNKLTMHFEASEMLCKREHKSADLWLFLKPLSRPSEGHSK